MSILQDDDLISEEYNKQVYDVPAVIREEKEKIPFETALIIALILHPAVILIMLLGSLLLKLLGIDFDLFKKPDIKPKDIEFVLVEKEAPPIDKNTKNRADINSQAGGKHDAKRPVSLPQTSAPKSPDKKPTPPAPAKPAAPKPQPKQQPPKPSAPPKTEAKKTEQPAAPKPTTQAPKPEAPKPTAAPSVSAPKPNPASNFNIPIPKSNIPQIAQPTAAPVTSAPKVGGGTSGGTGSGTGTATPSPSFSPTTAGKSGAGGTGTGAGGGGRFNGTGSGKGNVGNPGPGNPNGAPGIDAIKEPDFGPYMKELQRRIKMNWDPPKGNESKRVVLLFKIARDGRLISVQVHKSSGLQAADNAAINAVKLTAPFRPLPPEFKGNSIDIQFTFDYNVLGASRY